MIDIHVRGHEIGAGILENGNVGIVSLDKQSQIRVTIEIDSRAWKESFVPNINRLKGVGIAGLAPLVVPGQDGKVG